MAQIALAVHATVNDVTARKQNATAARVQKRILLQAQNPVPEKRAPKQLKADRKAAVLMFIHSQTAPEMLLSTEKPAKKPNVFRLKSNTSRLQN